MEALVYPALERFGLKGLGTRTLIMGILNVTPDSFSDGGNLVTIDKAVTRAQEMVGEGADIVDIGGESTRPRSTPVDEKQELQRVLPVIKALHSQVSIPISIDTYKASVARAALEAGASIINDISAASFDPAMPALIAEANCPAILMHIKGTPRDMQSNPHYEDVVSEIIIYLRERIDQLIAAGVNRDLLIIDPGFGFGKTVEHNLELLRRLREFTRLGRPILMGTSRKATIGKILGDVPVTERLHGTSATVAAAIVNGADIVRVHDVREMAMVAKMTDAIFRQ